MLSFAITHLSFYYLLFLLCVTTGLVASAPTTHHRNLNTNHHHLLHSRPHFPYGKLADRLLHFNDRNNDVPYMIDNLDEDSVYPNSENHHHNSVPIFPSSSSSLPIPSPPKVLVPIDTIPNVGTITTTATTTTITKELVSFAYRLQDIIKKFVVQEWDSTLLRWRTMARDQLSSMNS